VSRAGPELWIAGFPGYWGGADTELDHQIDLLLEHGVRVHLVPLFGFDPRMRRSAVSRGCRVHRYEPGIFRGKTLASYANKNFLATLPEIMASGRPAKVIWFNCMTRLRDGELRAHREGWIDYFGFVSEYQRRCLEPLLQKAGPVRSFPYRPYFNLSRVAWRPRSWHGSYCLGRISRDDASKYAPDTWRIFNRVLVPSHLRKRVFVLGFGPHAACAIGPPPASLDVQVWPCDAIPVSRFFRSIDTMIHKTWTSRESYCRVVIEAYAHGVVPIVEDDFAFPESVLHGLTGFRSSDSDEMSYYGTLLAWDPKAHRRMARRGHDFLRSELIDARMSWAGWEHVLSTR
jgi:hypothetical protein